MESFIILKNHFAFCPVEDFTDVCDVHFCSMNLPLGEAAVATCATIKSPISTIESCIRTLFVQKKTLHLLFSFDIMESDRGDFNANLEYWFI